VRPDEVRRGDALTTSSTVTSTELGDVRLHRAAAGGRAVPGEPLPAQCLVHLGSAQVSAAARPLGDETARLRLARRLPVRRGDRLLLRDPGQHLVLGSAVVLDPAPPALTRRGDARRRSVVLASVPDEPDAGEELRRRGVVTAQALRALGLSTGAVAGLRAVRVPGGWMVDEEESHRLRAQLLALVEEHARGHPLEPGLSLEEARQHLALPDVALIHALFETAGAADGMVIRQGRVSVRGNEDGDLPASVAAAVDAVRRDLAQRPFLAPDAARLADLGLDRQSLGAAVRAGLLDRVGTDVFLLPDWAERASHALAALGRPFTVSEARQALDTTRRVAVPLLERLDAERVTRRLPDDRREVR
jgi:selenocysteine-specific elongation factor